MIEVYSWPTPNGHKVRIMAEECVVPYRVIPVDIGSGAQFAHEFLAISPNYNVPAIIDPDGPDGEPILPFESGAILLYLAGKTGRLLPADTRGRYEMLAGVRKPLTDDRAREVLFGATQHTRH
jgi:GST-like protein